MIIKKLNKITALILIELILVLPVYTSALTISNIHADATDKSAFVTWITDKESATKINYGRTAANLNNTISDVRLVKNHSVLLRNLDKDTAYFFELIAQTPTEILVDNKTGEFYRFVTLPVDTVAPFIDVELPEAVDSNELDITGRTEVNTKIELFVNGQVRRIITFDDGEIRFYGVDLLPNEPNIILLQAVDSAGNAAQKQFIVVSDLVAPAVTLVPALPDVIDARSMNLAGTLSETARINITLNDASVYSAEAASFSTNLQFIEGDNQLIIAAADKAGRETVIDKTIISDTLHPAVANLTPVTGSVYYEGRAVLDLSFATEPGAEVRLYKDSKGSLTKYDEIKPAGSDGRVRFDNVELEGAHFGPYSAAAEWPPLREVQPATGAGLAQQTQQGTEASERQVRLIIAVKDIAGHVTTHIANYQIVTCWSGELDFHVDNIIAYNTPTLLSPERLKEGSELVSFILNVSYQGEAPPGNWSITDIRFDKACRGGRLGEPEFFLEDDIRYDTACRILPNDPRVRDSNNAKTLWYIRYDLGSTAEFTDFSEITWDEIGRHELIFPLKLTITYREKNPQGQWIQKTQTNCMQVAYFVDIPIDFSDVLPDWMLEDLPKSLNSTINDLDKIIEDVEKVTEFTATICLVSMIGKFVTKIVRRILCRLDSRAARLGLSQTGCPPTDEARMSLPLDEETGRQPPMPQATGTLTASCPRCAKWWEAEAKLYNAQRWLCDRVLCHKAPAEWTGSPKITDAQIRLAERESRSCAAEERAGVLPLLRIENCARTYGPSPGRDLLNLQFQHTNICYLYDSTLYVEGPDLGPDVDGVYILTKASRGEGLEGIKVIKEGNNYATARNRACDDICKDSNRNSVGRCESETTCTDSTGGENLGEGNLMGYSNDCWVQQNALSNTNPQQCCCRTPATAEPARPNTAAPTQKWEYREQELNRQNRNYGTYYPENRYFEGRDLPACFGQNYFWESPAEGHAGKTPMIDPFRQHLSSFQCLCLTGIRSRLAMFKNILMGMMNCLIQIKTTGTADAGVCKEMFTQYVCDMIYQIYTWFKRGCIPNPFGSDIQLRGQETGVQGADVPSPGSIAASEIFGSFRDMSSSIEAEYGGSQFANFLSMEEREMSRKICLAAFGFDVGLDFDTMLDMTYTTQFAASVLGLGLKRDFLTYNPDNNLATYAYRGSWTIYPGCEIASYKVDLTCVNMEERSRYRGIDCSASVDPENPAGCDCLMSSAPYGARSRLFYTGGPLAAETLEDRDHHTNVESQHRYDHFRIQLFLHPDADPEKCFPQGHEDGIFYFPITDNTLRDLLDCSLDLERGQFRCSRGLEWEQKGEARFGYFTPSQCGHNETCNLLCYDSRLGNWRDCKDVIYAVNDNIRIKPKIIGTRNQCLKITLASEAGETVYGQMHRVGESSSLEGEYTEEPEYTLGVVRPDQFAETGDSIRSNDNCSVGNIQRGANTIPGRTLNIEFEKKEEEAVTYYKIISTPDFNEIYNHEGGRVDLRVEWTPVRTIQNLQFRFAGFNFTLTPLREGRCTIETVRGTGGTEQRWPLTLELLHPDNQGSCAGTTERIFGVGEETAISKNLNVSRTRPAAPAPPLTASYPNSFNYTYGEHTYLYLVILHTRTNTKAEYRIWEDLDVKWIGEIKPDGTVGTLWRFDPGLDGKGTTVQWNQGELLSIERAFLAAARAAQPGAED
jgi:hypothetical protein